MNKRIENLAIKPSLARRDELSQIELEVLLKIHERDQAVSQLAEPTGDQWAQQDWQTMRDHGAPWATTLFGERLPAKIATRYRSAFKRLTERGFVEPFREFGRNVTHAKLTVPGRTEAAKHTDQPPAVAVDQPADEWGSDANSIS